MSFVEIIAFAVSVLSLLYLFVRNLGEVKHENVIEEMETKIYPSPAVHPPHHFKAKKAPPAEKGKFEKNRSEAIALIKHRELSAEISQQPSRARVSLNHLPRLKDLVIYKEILDKPKGLK